MTVKKLIDELKEYDDDFDVMILTSNGNINTINYVTRGKPLKFKNNEQIINDANFIYLGC